MQSVPILNLRHRGRLPCCGRSRRVRRASHSRRNWLTRLNNNNQHDHDGDERKRLVTLRSLNWDYICHRVKDGSATQVKKDSACACSGFSPHLPRFFLTFLRSDETPSPPKQDFCAFAKEKAGQSKSNLPEFAKERADRFRGHFLQATFSFVFCKNNFFCILQKKRSPQPPCGRTVKLRTRRIVCKRKAIAVSTWNACLGRPFPIGQDSTVSCSHDLQSLFSLPLFHSHAALCHWNRSAH